jgi:transporter family protein
MQNPVILALISMVFAGVTAVIAKLGLKNVSGDTGLAVRTIFVFGFVVINTLVFKHLKEFKALTTSDVGFLALSALTTTLSWIFYYRAVKLGDVSQVALIDKASILVTLLLSFLVLKEPFTWRVALGGGLMLAGLLVLVLK